MMKKRERTTNFSREETDTLVSLVEKYKNIIENKKSDAVTWQEKDRAWKEIETAFNSFAYGPFRDAKHLKSKYECLKKATRKKSSIIRSERYKTGGGVNGAVPLSSAERVVKEMILLSVEGEESVCDSDKIDVTGTTYNNIEEFNKGVVPLIPNIEVVQTPVDIHEIDHDNFSIGNEADEAITTASAVTQPEMQLLESEESNGEYTIMSPPEKQEALSIATPHKWSTWKPSSLKTKKHPALCTPIERRTFDVLAEKKIELINLQIEVVKEEQKSNAEILALQKKKAENDLLHQQFMQMEEKRKLLLEIELLEAKKNLILPK